jgi:hypothetical protein
VLVILQAHTFACGIIDLAGYFIIGSGKLEDLCGEPWL